MGLAAVEGVIAVMSAVKRADIPLGAHIRIMVADNMIGWFRELLPSFDYGSLIHPRLRAQAVGNIDRHILLFAGDEPVVVRVAKISQFHDKIHIMLPAVL